VDISGNRSGLSYLFGRGLTMLMLGWLQIRLVYAIYWMGISGYRSGINYLFGRGFTTLMLGWVQIYSAVCHISHNVKTIKNLFLIIYIPVLYFTSVVWNIDAVRISFSSRVGVEEEKEMTNFAGPAGVNFHSLSLFLSLSLHCLRTTFDLHFLVTDTVIP
jgi:hypothetical protein